MGDYNINLHKMTINEDKKFEENVISSGFAPLISISTHEKPGCEKTCIDNIVCNYFDNIIFSGTIMDRLSHHLPIFSFSKIKQITNDRDTASNTLPQFDYSNENMEKFSEKIKKTFCITPEYNYNFSGFAKTFCDIINETCLSKTKSKRTLSSNPWISMSIQEKKCSRKEMFIFTALQQYINMYITKYINMYITKVSTNHTFK